MGIKSSNRQLGKPGFVSRRSALRTLFQSENELAVNYGGSPVILMDYDAIDHTCLISLAD